MDASSPAAYILQSSAKDDALIEHLPEAELVDLTFAPHVPSDADVDATATRDGLMEISSCPTFFASG